jgi:hypothetical protein
MVPADSNRVPRDPLYSGYLKEFFLFRLQDFHLLWFHFPLNSTIKRTCNSYIEVLQPQSEDWFGLIPFRSPLLRESIFLSFPLVTKMFQFARLLSLSLCIHDRITVHYYCWVSPFGNLRVKAYLQLAEAYRCSSRPSSASSAKASAMRPY